MSAIELALTEGSLAAAYLLAIGAFATGVISVTPQHLRIARNCFFATCAIFAGFAIMWGIATNPLTWPKIVAVGVLAGLAGIAAVATARFIGQAIQTPNESPPNVVQGPPANPSSRPTGSPMTDLNPDRQQHVEGILRELIEEYHRTHPTDRNIPIPWLNQRLGAMGETFSVALPPQAPLISMRNSHDITFENPTFITDGPAIDQDNSYSNTFRNMTIISPSVLPQSQGKKEKK